MTGATLKEPVQAAIVCQPQSRRLLRKGWFHMIGGAGIVVLTICFPQDPVLFLIGLAPWVLYVPDPYVGSGSTAAVLGLNKIVSLILPQQADGPPARSYSLSANCRLMHCSNRRFEG